MTLIIHTTRFLSVSSIIPKGSIISSVTSKFLYENDSSSYFLHSDLRSRNSLSWIFFWHCKLSFYKPNVSLSPTHVFILLYFLIPSSWPIFPTNLKRNILGMLDSSLSLHTIIIHQVWLSLRFYYLLNCILPFTSYGFDWAPIISFKINLLIDNIAFVLISSQATLLNATKLFLLNRNRIMLYPLRTL